MIFQSESPLKAADKIRYKDCWSLGDKKLDGE